MGRAPCCNKMGLKKGSWTPPEDLILINYINTYGHKNWCSLPKQAELLRCGKSCRFRWTNYLRPDIKRGNFTREEDIIIQLHEMLGNRWSAIAATLPGRTDNEIKNVWHTHLKKRPTHHTKSNANQNQQPLNFPSHPHVMIEKPLSSPQCLSGDVSINNAESLDDHFWSQVLSPHDSDYTNCFPATCAADLNFQFPFSPLTAQESVILSSSSSVCDSVDFWYI